MDHGTEVELGQVVVARNIEGHHREVAGEMHVEGEHGAATRLVEADKGSSGEQEVDERLPESHDPGQKVSFDDLQRNLPLFPYAVPRRPMAAIERGVKYHEIC